MEESSHNAFDDGVDKEEIEQFLQDMDEYVPTVCDFTLKRFQFNIIYEFIFCRFQMR